MTEPDAEKLTTLLREAIEARMKSRELIAQIELLIAGPEKEEGIRAEVEERVLEWIEDYAFDAETIDGFGLADTKELLELLERTGAEADLD